MKLIRYSVTRIEHDDTLVDREEMDVTPDSDDIADAGNAALALVEVITGERHLIEEVSVDRDVTVVYAANQHCCVRHEGLLTDAYTHTHWALRSVDARLHDHVSQALHALVLPDHYERSE